MPRSDTRSEISGRTRLLAILADPVAQAQAPAMINAALAETGRDAVMVPMHVTSGDLERALGGLRAVRSFAGAIVSMPHKTAVVSHLDEVTIEARQIGACNIVRRNADGRLIGTMLDGEGFVAGLGNAGHDVRGKRIHLAGAGGAASAIAFALAKHGAACVTIQNRTTAKAEALARRVRAAWPDCAVEVGSPNAGDHEIVVNATSLGMQEGDPLPFTADVLGPGVLAAEIVIAPERTAFLAEAERRGSWIHFGRPMLAAQIPLMIEFMLGPRRP